ncbi:MAG: tetratricopeptide repeat protein [Promethearchaeota archaeon]
MDPDKKTQIPEEIQQQIAIGLKEFKKTYNIPETEQVVDYRCELASKLGIFYFQADDFQEARKFLFVALKGYEQQQNVQKLAATQGLLGSLFLHSGDYALSLKYYENAYEYWQKTSFLNERIICLQNIGINYLHIDQEAEASEALLEALRMAVSLLDEVQFALTIQILLEHYERLHRFDMLFELKKKALEFWVQLQLPQRQYKTSIDLGVLSQVLEDYDQALVYFKKAFNVGYNEGNLKDMFLAQGFLAECFLKLNDIEKAKYTYLQAFKIAIYINITENFKDQIDAMRVSLLALGVPKEKLVEEGQKALEKGQKESN